MGVKSTVYLTRAEAELKYHELYAKLHPRDNKLDLYNQELEDILEDMNDRAHDGEGFENYIIREES